jgi:hypothetical protein
VVQEGLVQEEEMVDEEHIEPKGFQVLEEEAEDVLEEEKEGHVDAEPGSQLEDVQADWDTGKKKN